MVVPEIRALDALSAMEERPRNDDDHRKLGYPTALRHGAADRMVPNDAGAARDPQSLALTGHEEDQADARILQHVVERVDPTIAAAIRNRERCLVETPHEPRAVSFWRQVDHPERIGRSDHDKGRSRDEFAAAAIKLVQDLAGEPSVGRPDDSS